MKCAPISANRMLRQLGIVSILCGATPVAAQEAATPASDATTSAFKQLDMIEASRKKFAAAPKKRRCGAANDEGEIVVCGRDSGEDQRIPPSSETDPTSRDSLRTGALRPPSFAKPSCLGQPNCIRVGRVPPPVYYFDIKALPEAADGSDAAKAGADEKPAR
jgi:hypothetical protein